MSERNHESTDDMLNEYDFSGGVRGRYADRFSDDCKLIVLDPDVAEPFPTHTPSTRRSASSSSNGPQRDAKSRTRRAGPGTRENSAACPPETGRPGE
jgi:hypothetical protein